MPKYGNYKLVSGTHNRPYKKHTYPLFRSFDEFCKAYPDETACEKALYEARWGKGFVCPKCGITGPCYKLKSRPLYVCSACRKQSSVLSGTAIEGTRLPLTKWFRAFYLFSSDKRGFSSIALASILQVQQKTAWYMIRRIQQAMSARDERYMLSGCVQIDNCYVGSPTVGKKRGVGTEKTNVFIAVSKEMGDGAMYCHMKAKVISNTTSKKVVDFAKRYISSDATIRSDDNKAYAALADEGFKITQKPVKHKTGQNANYLNYIDHAVSNLKAMILGTYHGLPAECLQGYIDAYCYRFNRRYYGGFMTERLLTAVCECPPEHRYARSA